MAALVMVSTFGAVNGIILVGPRVYYSMAQRRPAVPVARRRSIRVSARRIARSCCRRSGRRCSRSTNTYGALFSRVIYTEWIFFALMAVGPDAAAPAAGLPAGVSRLGLSDRARRCSSSSSVVIVVDPDRRRRRATALIGLGHRARGPAGVLVWAGRDHARTQTPHDRHRLSQSLLPARIPRRARPLGQHAARSRTTPTAIRSCTTRATTTSWCAGIATSRTGRPCSTSRAWTRRSSRSRRRARTSRRRPVAAKLATITNDAFARVRAERRRPLHPAGDAAALRSDGVASPSSCARSTS